jgi:ribonuclease Z
MAKVVVLGSSFVMPDETHENTHLALVGREGIVMIDAAAHPVLQLRKAGLSFNEVTDLILTHFHPDHVYGVPMLIIEMWLRKRTRPLRIHGPRHCVERIEKLMAAYEWDSWPGLYPVSFHSVEDQTGGLVLDRADLHITAVPVEHFLPTIGLRVEDKEKGTVLGYSCDTEPCPAVRKLAAGADLLIHEAAGKGPGHTSAAQAGEIAREVGAKRLVLIHYPTNGADTSHLVPEATQTFAGPVTLAEDFMVLEF